MTLFNRFAIDLMFSRKEPWYSELKSGDHQTHFISVCLVERRVDDLVYSGWQIILFGLHLILADAKSLRKIDKCH